MKIGIVCEGVTDFLAIKYYLSNEMKTKGINTNFILLQPLPNNTNPGGWSHALTWLANNPPTARRKLFQKGLFANSSIFSELDAIAVHLDTDVLNEPSFINFLNTRNIHLQPCKTIQQKSLELSRIIDIFLKKNLIDKELKEKHISIPIAESSEAWCIAAEGNFLGNAETLTGQNLCNEYGAALARISGKSPKQSYTKINKKEKSRDNFCKKTSHNHANIRQCILFNNAAEKIIITKLFSDVF